MEKAKTLRAFASSREPQKEEAKPARVPKLRFPEFRDLPSWSETTVGRISDTVIAGGTPSTSEKKFWGGDIRWMNSGELNDKKVSEVQGRITLEGLNNSSTKLIPPRCVLIGLAGQGKTRGTVALNLVELCTNQSIAAIFPNDSAFNSDFLYHDLDKRYNELRRLSAGGEGRGGLNLQIIKSLKVALPSPAEQQKIAECLSSVDEVIAAQARKLDALKTHKKGLMQQLFPREGETQPRLRFPEFRKAGEWEMKRVDEQGSVLAGKALAANAPGPQRPYLRTKNVLDGAIDLSDVLTMPMTDGEFTRFEILDGDVLLNEGQSLELVGRASIYRGEFGQRCAMQNALLRFRAFPSTSPEFAAQYFRQCQKDGTFANVATKTTSVAHLGSSRFSALELAWPKLPEQHRIATCLSSLDALIAAETQKLEALKTHKRGLMQQLFPSPEEVAG